MLEYIDEAMPAESAVAFGLHPNAEIGFKLREAEAFCGSLLAMQVGIAGGAGFCSVVVGCWSFGYRFYITWAACHAF